MNNIKLIPLEDSDSSGNGEWQYSEEMLNAVAVYRVDVDKISCKAK